MPDNVEPKFKTAEELMAWNLGKVLNAQNLLPEKTKQ